MEAEKIYCCDRPSDNSALWASLMSNRNSGAEWAMWNNNNWSNNPISSIVILGMMRFMFGDGWQNSNNPEINSRFNQLSTQLSDNHNTDILNEAVKGNTSRIGELANNLNVDLRAIQSGICDLRSGIQAVEGATKLSAEQVINAVNLGDTGIISALKDCCCQNKELVLRGNYENQLATERQTNTLGSQMASNFASQQLQACKDNGAVISRIDQLANGITQGFSATAYEAAKNARDIMANNDANTQRVLDALNNHWQQETALALQDEKFKNSQLQQNQYIASLINKGCGCGC